MAETFFTHSTMLDFCCLGDRCEDTCCRDWDIRFDKKHFTHLEQQVSSEPGQKELFNKYIHLLEEGDDKNYALVQLNEQGYCPFLSAEGWCDLHRQHGIAPLSNVCAFYPRVVMKLDDHHEVSGALSCPEMARHILLDEQAFRIVEMPAGILPRPDDFPVVRSINTQEGDDYLALFPGVRQALLQIMAEEDLSFEARLFALSSLSHSLSGFYHQGCRALNAGQLETELERFQSGAGLNRLEDFVSEYTPDTPLAMIVVQAILRLRLQQFPDEPLSKLVQTSFENYQQRMADVPELYGGNLPPEELWRVYRQQAEKVSEHFPALLDRMFSRYVQNCLFREWFVNMPSPFSYMHMLTIRIAMLRFLVMSHPQVMACLDRKDAAEVQAEELQGHFIEVFYRFSRAVDHNMNFLQVVYNAITEQDMMHYDYALPFIKF